MAETRARQPAGRPDAAGELDWNGASLRLLRLLRLLRHRRYLFTNEADTALPHRLASSRCSG